MVRLHSQYYIHRSLLVGYHKFSELNFLIVSCVVFTHTSMRCAKGLSNLFCLSVSLSVCHSGEKFLNLHEYRQV